MVVAGYIVELVFTPLGLVPAERKATVMESSFTWNYTTWLNLAVLLLATVLVIRIIRSGSVAMLRMMGGEPEAAGGDPASEASEG